MTTYQYWKSHNCITSSRRGWRKNFPRVTFFTQFFFQIFHYLTFQLYRPLKPFSLVWNIKKTSENHKVIHPLDDFIQLVCTGNTIHVKVFICTACLEPCSEHCQRLKTKPFAKLVNGFWLLGAFYFSLWMGHGVFKVKEF